MTDPVTIIDTGVLVALADADDTDHTACTKWFSRSRNTLVIPAAIIGEVCYILGTHCGSRVEAAFVESLASDEPFHVEPLTSDDYVRAASLIRKYGDFPLGGSDAAVVAVAERYAASEVATLDHRHFRAAQPAHVAAFSLVP